MASLVKKFGQLRQWTGELVGGTQKTDTSEDFKRLDSETTSRLECVGKLENNLTRITKHLSKKKELPGDKTPRTPMEAFAVSLTRYGSILDDDSIYGNALQKSGSSHDKLALEQLSLAQTLKDGYLHTLHQVLEDQKEYEQLKRKLENRRLDFDAKLNQAQKAKKENPKQEEETREDHLNIMIKMFSDELNYHENCASILRSLTDDLNGLAGSKTISRHNSAPKISQMNRSRTGSSGFSEESKPNTSIPKGIAAMAPVPIPVDIKSITPPFQPKKPSVSRPKKLVEATFKFDAESPAELSLKKGDIIEVTNEIDAGWWEGFIVSEAHRKGMFPCNYTQPYNDQKMNTPPLIQSRSRAASSLEKVFETSLAKCSICGCEDFSKNAFRPEQCGNCFHKH